MRSLLIGLALLVVSLPTPGLGQLPATRDVVSRVKVQSGCDYESPLENSDVDLAPADPEILRMVEKIVAVTGLRQNFTVGASQATHYAAAFLAPDGKRVIIYNPAFVKSLEGNSKREVVLLDILAHELGHHLQGHTTLSGGSQPDREIEADDFAGFALCALGYDGDDRTYALRMIVPGLGSKTHPCLAARLGAVLGGGLRWTIQAPDTTNARRQKGEQLLSELREQIKQLIQNDGRFQRRNEDNREHLTRLLDAGGVWPTNIFSVGIFMERDGINLFLVPCEIRAAPSNFPLYVDIGPTGHREIIDPFGFIWIERGSRWVKKDSLDDPGESAERSPTSSPRPGAPPIGH